LIMSSTVRFFSSLIILSRTFKTALLPNPSITKADNASSRFVLSVNVNISPVPDCFPSLSFRSTIILSAVF
jgi:hypothetical protein